MTTQQLKQAQLKRIQDLRLKSKPVSYSNYFVDGAGKLQQQVIDLKLKAVNSGDDRTIEGYLAVFGVKDMDGEIFIKGCFARSIAEHGPDSNANFKILMLWCHKQDDPIGRFLELKEDDYGLYFKAAIDKVPSGDRTLVQVKSGTINQFSFGFLHVWDSVEWDDTSDALLNYEVQLFEGSPVSIGNNMETYAIKSAGDFSAAKENLDYETEELLKGLPRSKQLELKQLITKHINLAQIAPGNRESVIDDVQGVMKVGNYKLNINEFKQ